MTRVLSDVCNLYLYSNIIDFPLFVWYDFDDAKRDKMVKWCEDTFSDLLNQGLYSNPNYEMFYLDMCLILDYKGDFKLLPYNKIKSIEERAKKIAQRGDKELWERMNKARHELNKLILKDWELAYEIRKMEKESEDADR